MRTARKFLLLSPCKTSRLMNCDKNVSYHELRQKRLASRIATKTYRLTYCDKNVSRLTYCRKNVFRLTYCDKNSLASRIATKTSRLTYCDKNISPHVLQQKHLASRIATKTARLTYCDKNISPRTSQTYVIEFCSCSVMRSDIGPTIDVSCPTKCVVAGREVTLAQIVVSVALWDR